MMCDHRKREQLIISIYGQTRIYGLLPRKSRKTGHRDYAAMVPEAYLNIGFVKKQKPSREMAHILGLHTASLRTNWECRMLAVATE
jgi:hypothetical protein